MHQSRLIGQAGDHAPQLHAATTPRAREERPATAAVIAGLRRVRDEGQQAEQPTPWIVSGAASRSRSLAEMASSRSTSATAFPPRRYRSQQVLEGNVLLQLSTKADLELHVLRIHSPSVSNQSPYCSAMYSPASRLPQPDVGSRRLWACA